jgi:hypothetical protein
VPGTLGRPAAQPARLVPPRTAVGAAGHRPAARSSPRRAIRCLRAAGARGGAIVRVPRPAARFDSRARQARAAAPSFAFLAGSRRAARAWRARLSAHCAPPARPHRLTLSAPPAAPPAGDGPGPADGGLDISSPRRADAEGGGSEGGESEGSGAEEGGGRGDERTAWTVITRLAGEGCMHEWSRGRHEGMKACMHAWSRRMHAWMNG